MPDGTSAEKHMDKFSFKYIVVFIPYNKTSSIFPYRSEAEFQQTDISLSRYI